MPGICAGSSKKQYIVLSDLMLLQGRRLTQIDHVVVSVYGIFVIETKNYTAPSPDGTQGVLDAGAARKAVYFRSPFRQNYAHIRALMQLLGLDEDCFSPLRRLQMMRAGGGAGGGAWNSWCISEVRRTIRRQRQMLLAWDDVRYYAGTILCANLDTPQARQTHLEQIDNEIAYRNFALRNGLCPRCGGKLVLRHGTYGDFYGCSNIRVPLHPGKRGIRQHRIPQNGNAHVQLYIHLNCVQKKTK
ncbi:MAG: NERD domain-containing protein [Ruminococcus callidus]